MNGKTFFALAALLPACAVAAQAETTSMARLMALGQDVTCTYEKNDEQGRQDGTIYASNNKLRGEINMTTAEGTYLMHMVREGDTHYMWGGPFGENQGMKMQVSAADAQNLQGRRQGPDVNEELNYDCHAWSADPSMFVVPSDIQFNDMSQMIPPGLLLGGGGGMGGLACSACDQAPPGEAQEQCRQALGC